MCWAACSRPSDPRAAFEHARQTLRHGDMVLATDEAIQGYQKFHGVSSEWAWKFRILWASALFRRGKNNEALTILASDPLQCPPGDLLIRRLRLDGQIHTAQHMLREAEQDFLDAENLCAGSESIDCLDVISAKAHLEMDRGRYSDAHRLFARVLPRAQKSDNRFWEVSTLLDMSWSSEAQGHLDEGLDWASTARQIAVSNGFADLAKNAIGNMGWAYYKLGDGEKAKSMLDEARTEAERLGDLTSQVGWLAAEGYIDMDRQSLDFALQAFQQSFQLAQKINNPQDIVNALIALAFISEQTNKLDDAQRYADEALKMAMAGGNEHDIVYPLLVEGRVAAKEHDTSGAQAAFYQVTQSKNPPVFLKWEAERSLARLYEDENHTEAASSEYRTALDTFEGARCGLHERADTRLPFLSNAAHIYEDYIHFLISKNRIDEALRVADYSRARTLAEGLGTPCKPKFAPDPLNASEIARRAGGTILFYALGQEHSYLWAITPHQVRLFPLAQNQSEIDKAVQRYRKLLEGPPGIFDKSNDGSALYQMLVAPAQELLNKEAAAQNTNVFIIPDGSLNSLNFETLTPQPNHYWIEDVTIANATSLRLLPTSHGTSENFNGRLLLIGDASVPDSGPDNRYPHLPNSARQMENVEKYFPAGRQTVIEHAQAYPTAYLNDHPEQFSYIHFVAHGEASRLSPLDSAIILSRDPAASPTAGDDAFKLYAREIIGTPKLQARLVTISACNSTGNRTYSGEGLVGLSWAFLHAGAHNVIAALWDVSDASTAAFMDHLYSELNRGRTPEAALRAAKLSLLHSSDTSRRPFYWAPFQLYTGR